RPAAAGAVAAGGNRALQHGRGGRPPARRAVRARLATRIEKRYELAGVAAFLDDPVALVTLDHVFDLRQRVIRDDREPLAVAPNVVVFLRRQLDLERAETVRAFAEVL